MIKKIKNKIYETICILSIIFIIPDIAFSQNINLKNSNSNNFFNTNYNLEIFFSKKNKYLLGALKINLKPGWKIYWKNPGEAGLPPNLNWENVKNIKNVEFLFPAPNRFSFFDIDTFGYKNEVLFPIKIVKEDEKIPIQGTLNFKAQICNKICVPIEDNILINSKYDVANDELLKEIDNSLLKIPFENKNPKKFFYKISFFNEDLKLFLTEKINKINFDLIIEDERSNIFTSLFKSKNQDNEKYVLIKDIKIDEKKTNTFKVTFLSEKLNFYQIIKVPSNYTISTNFIYILFISFIAGLILNLMPCVLPILSLKIASFLNMPNSNTIAVKKKILLQILGIIFSFLIIFLITFLFKKLGIQMSWGFQFQNEIFLSIIVLLIFLFGFNLLGFFEIVLPSKVLIFIQNIKLKKIEDFLAGSLMTILSTPCTAPFVGSAVMYGLSGTIYESFFVFLFMGIGLSFPLIFLFFYPQSIKILPKTGKWMITLKKSMGVLFIFSGLWFSSILINNFIVKNKKIVVNQNINWSNWEIKKDPDLIKRLINQDRIILLDITADWCLTCKFNKIFVFNDSKIKKIIDDKNIVTLQMDWTKKSKAIESFLISKNRYGIPYNELYSKIFFDGIVLPELLDKESLIKLINESK